MRHSAEKFVLTLIVSIVPFANAAASACSGQIAQLQQVMPRNIDGSMAPVGSAPQSVGAKLTRQPTPASVQRAELGARAGVEATLAQAQQYDAQGKTQECESAVGRARLMLNP
jgi:hypothetical protein